MQTADNPECGKGLTISAGKVAVTVTMRLGQANGGAQRCGCRSIRQEALDSLVLGDVIARVLEPERLRELLSRVLEVPSENSTRGPETLEYETPAEHFEACVAMTD